VPPSTTIFCGQRDYLTIIAAGLICAVVMLAPPKLHSGCVLAFRNRCAGQFNAKFSRMPFGIAENVSAYYPAPEEWAVIPRGRVRVLFIRMLHQIAKHCGFRDGYRTDVSLLFCSDCRNGSEWREWFYAKKLLIGRLFCKIGEGHITNDFNGRGDPGIVHDRGYSIIHDIALRRANYGSVYGQRLIRYESPLHRFQRFAVDFARFAHRPPLASCVNCIYEVAIAIAMVEATVQNVVLKKHLRQTNTLQILAHSRATVT
jgi:hypothetical protein